MYRTCSALCLVLVTLGGCATQYPGPRTAANSHVALRASGLQKHLAYPNDKLLVRVFLGKDIRGTELGMITLSPDLLSSGMRLDQGVEYTLWVTSIESHFGGFTSCGFYVPLTPGKDEAYKVDYGTSKARCEVIVTRTDRQGASSKVLEATNVAGGTQFTAKVVRY